VAPVVFRLKNDALAPDVFAAIEVRGRVAAFFPFGDLRNLQEL
jgi:hypothetical protein